jgi:hypothetical protein
MVSDDDAHLSPVQAVELLASENGVEPCYVGADAWISPLEVDARLGIIIKSGGRADLPDWMVRGLFKYATRLGQAPYRRPRAVLEIPAAQVASARAALHALREASEEAEAYYAETLRLRALLLRELRRGHLRVWAVPAEASDETATKLLSAEEFEGPRELSVDGLQCSETKASVFCCLRMLRGDLLRIIAAEQPAAVAQAESDAERWMSRACQAAFDAGRRTKREDALKQCQRAGFTYHKAREAWNALPDYLRGSRGKR